jgi:hypothetical protein
MDVLLEMKAFSYSEEKMMPISVSTYGKMKMIELHRLTVNMRLMGHPAFFCMFTEAKEWGGKSKIPEMIEKAYARYGTHEVPGRWGWLSGHREREPVVRFVGMMQTDVPFVAVPHGEDWYLLLNAGKDAMHGETSNVAEVRESADTPDRAYYMARERGMVPARWVYLGSEGPSEADLEKQLEEGHRVVQRMMSVG